MEIENKINTLIDNILDKYNSENEILKEINKKTV